MTVKISCEGFSLTFDCNASDCNDMDILHQAFLIIARRSRSNAKQVIGDKR